MRKNQSYHKKLQYKIFCHYLFTLVTYVPSYFLGITVFYQLLDLLPTPHPVF